MSHKIPIPIRHYSRRIAEFLLKHFIPEDHFREEGNGILVTHIQNLLINLIRVVICDNRDHRMPGEVIHETDVFEAFAKATRLNPDLIGPVLLETILLDNFLEEIATIVSGNKWDLWGIEAGSSFFLINHGDFRILQWEKEHLVNGVYVECPVVE